MSPSINMYGNMVIDLNSETIPFTCVVDGNEAITDWQITVSRVKDNSIVFDSGQQKLDTPFFPINNRNQNVPFSIDLKKYFDKATTYRIPATSTYDSNKVYYNNSSNEKYVYDKNTYSSDYKNLYYINFVNSADAYYWNITFVGSANSTSCSAPEVFYANSTPETSIYYSYDNNFDVLNDELKLSTDSENPTVLDKRKVFLKSTYTQSDNIPLKRYGWRITDITNNNIIIDTISKNQIYGIADDISCEFNGLVNQNTYLAELYIETQNGYFEILQSIEFKVDYVVKDIDADFQIMPLDNTSGIMLNWGNLRTTEGVVVGRDVKYIENFPVENSVSAKIPNDTSIIFESTANGKPLQIDENSYVVLSLQFDKEQDHTLFEMSGTDDYSDIVTRKLVYFAQDRGLRYTVTKGDIIATYIEYLSETIGDVCWYVITLCPLIDGAVQYKLVESVAEGGLFLDDDLYPSDNLYPNFGQWNKLREEVV